MTVSHHSSVQHLKFADDTTLEGLVMNSDEFEYRLEVNRCGVTITTFKFNYCSHEKGSTKVVLPVPIKEVCAEEGDLCSVLSFCF